MIPKIIWQTYETDFNLLPEEAKQCSYSWQIKNPDWKYMYMDSKQRDEFILHEFGNDWYSLFKNIKLGIVKANIWRCMIIYIYGGLYCDLDTVCNEPINQWIKNDYDMTLCRDHQENLNDFAIYTFAAKPNHPALKNIIDELYKNISNNKIDINNVIELTGESVWNKVINNNKYNFYCYKDSDADMFNGKAISHLGPSKNWNEKLYNNWMQDHDS